MSEDEPEPAAPANEARVHARRPFHYVWLVPVIAALVAGFLAVQSIVRAGPDITLNFKTAEGLTAGQTKIRHKAVELGIVKTVRLSADNHHVEVVADMQKSAERYLTANARFWVVRPRLAAGNISGLDTLVSGAYIEMDPGEASYAAQKQFDGLDEPPAVRSDEPGKAFVVMAERLGSLASGSPVFYRDIAVGEVLSYDAQPAALVRNKSIPVYIFVREPFDKLVRQGTHFWNASGVSLDLGAQGVQLRVESLQAALSGGIAFETPEDARDNPASPVGNVFELYPTQTAAANAGFRQRIKFMAYFQGSVRGLAVGAPVELFGIPIGTVTGIELQFDPAGNDSRVAVRLEVQPERIMQPEQLRAADPIDVAHRLVARGMRVQLRSTNYLTGQLVVAFDFFPDAKTAEVRQEGDTVVLPSMPGGLDSITTNLSQILLKIDNLPLEQIARNLNDTLAGARSITNSKDLHQSITALSSTLSSLQDLVRKTDNEVGPALKRLPDIAQGMQAAIERTSKLLGSADSGYGENSQFRRDIQRLLEQVSDTARSVRLLADYLDQHPEALLRGRSGRAGER